MKFSKAFTDAVRAAEDAAVQGMGTVLSTIDVAQETANKAAVVLDRVISQVDELLDDEEEELPGWRTAVDDVHAERAGSDQPGNEKTNVRKTHLVNEVLRLSPYPERLKREELEEMSEGSLEGLVAVMSAVKRLRTLKGL